MVDVLSTYAIGVDVLYFMTWKKCRFPAHIAPGWKVVGGKARVLLPSSVGELGCSSGSSRPCVRALPPEVGRGGLKEEPERPRPFDGAGDSLAGEDTEKDDNGSII